MNGCSGDKEMTDIRRARFYQITKLKLHFTFVKAIWYLFAIVHDADAIGA